MRPSPLSEPKCKGEGKIAEIKKYVGWNFYFNLHQIALPEDKADLYIGELQNIQKTRRTDETIMESLVGKVNVIGFVLPATRHFTARFRRRIIKCKQGDNELDDEEKKDSKLWIRFLLKAKSGLNINMTVH